MTLHVVDKKTWNNQKLDVIAHAHNPSTEMVDTRGIRIQSSSSSYNQIQCCLEYIWPCIEERRKITSGEMLLQFSRDEWVIWPEEPINLAVLFWGLFKCSFPSCDILIVIHFGGLPQMLPTSDSSPGREAFPPDLASLCAALRTLQCNCGFRSLLFYKDSPRPVIFPVWPSQNRKFS